MYYYIVKHQIPNQVWNDSPLKKNEIYYPTHKQSIQSVIIWNNNPIEIILVFFQNNPII